MNPTDNYRKYPIGVFFGDVYDPNGYVQGLKICVYGDYSSCAKFKEFILKFFFVLDAT
jgi:hypothetical protein